MKVFKCDKCGDRSNGRINTAIINKKDVKLCTPCAGKHNQAILARHNAKAVKDSMMSKQQFFGMLGRRCSHEVSLGMSYTYRKDYVFFTLTRCDVIDNNARTGKYFLPTVKDSEMDKVAECYFAWIKAWQKWRKTRARIKTQDRSYIKMIYSRSLNDDRKKRIVKITGRCVEKSTANSVIKLYNNIVWKKSGPVLVIRDSIDD